MRHSRSLYLVLIGTILLLLSFSVMVQVHPVLAQTQVPAAETTVAAPTEVPTGTPTTTPTVPAETPTATSTLLVEVPTATPTATGIGPGIPTSTVVPPAPPVTIPEPITVVLFGTGLAALSAAAASRRKNNDSGKGGVE